MDGGARKAACEAEMRRPHSALELGKRSECQSWLAVATLGDAMVSCAYFVSSRGLLSVGVPPSDVGVILRVREREREREACQHLDTSADHMRATKKVFSD